MSAAGSLLPGADDDLVTLVRRSRDRALMDAGTADAGFWREHHAEFTSVPISRLPATSEFGISHQLWGRVPLLCGAAARRPHPRRPGRACGPLARARRARRRARPGRLAGRALPRAALDRRSLERWAADCGPGLLKAHAPEVCMVCVALLNVANAAIVDADWRRRTGRLLVRTG